MLQAKNGKATEFKARADAIRAEILDETKTFTKDELEKKAEEINALEKRAALVADFTPNAEIERQGGDEELRRANPNSDAADEATKSYAGEMENIAKSVRKVFGGPNGYLLAIARRTDHPLSPEQHRVHTQLQDLHKRAQIVGAANDASGGEFLLPLQQVSEIFAVDNVQPGILEVARRYPVAGRSLRIPYVEQTDGTNTRPLAGIAAVQIVNEAGDIPEQEPTFKQRVLNVQAWKAYSEIGDETLSDDFTGQLSPTLQKLVGGQVMNEMNGYMTIDGTGTAQPMGALQTSGQGSLIKVPRQTAGDIKVKDAFNMYAAHTITGDNSRWLVNRTAIPALLSLTLGTNTLVTWITDLRGKPQMVLMGIPVRVCDLTNVLGAESDLALVNGDFYAVAIREALTVESSIHYKFKNDVTAFRFKARGGGLPIPTSTYAYKASGGVKVAPHSPFVTLDDVQAS